MLSQDRQALILDIIKEQGSITVTRLTEILETSESTVRRDLSFLANKGKINKVHGGATAISQEFIKLEDNIEEKLRNHGVSEELIKEFLNALNDCEFARFAPGDENQAMDKVYSSSIEVISKMENSIKH